MSEFKEGSAVKGVTNLDVAFEYGAVVKNNNSGRGFDSIKVAFIDEFGELRVHRCKIDDLIEIDYIADDFGNYPTKRKPTSISSKDGDGKFIKDDFYFGDKTESASLDYKAEYYHLLEGLRFKDTIIEALVFKLQMID